VTALAKHTVLVTGATGFVGGRLIEQWLQQGFCKVVAMTRKPDLAVFGGSRAEETIVGDLATMTDQDLLAACHGVDCVVHLVGTTAAECQTNPITGVNTNVLGTIRIARAAKAAGVKHHIQMSTIHVYGDLAGRLIDENTPPKPAHPYAVAHLAAEQLAQLESTSNFAVSVVRLSNAFGRPHHPAVRCWDLIANDLCRQAIETQQMFVRSSGYQERDFIPLSNVCRAVTHLIESNISGSQVYHLGSRKCLTIRELASQIENRYSNQFTQSLRTKYASQTPDTSSERLTFRIDRMLSLGYSESVTIDEELDDCLRFCQREFGAN
jgi:UDP-glucose 4-epimerase